MWPCVLSLLHRAEVESLSQFRSAMGQNFFSAVQKGFGSPEAITDVAT